MTAKRRTSVKGSPGVYFHALANGRRRYEISYVDSEGKRRWETVPGNLKDAEAAREDKRARMRKNERVAPTKKTIRELASEWLASQSELRPRTVERYELALRVHIVKRVGHFRVSELTVRDVSWLISEMRKAGLAGWTIRGHLTPLSLMMDYAVDEGWVAANPVKKLGKGSRPSVSKDKPRVLERDEIDRLLAAADPRYRLLLKTAVHTGLRYGELLGLTWRDVDLDKPYYVHVRKQLGRDGQRVEPKTDAAVREVPLMDSLVRELREHKARSPFSLPTHFVFCTDRGTPLQQRNVTRRGLDPAIRRAGLDGDGKPRLTMHCLRHGYGSMRLAEGATLMWVSAKMGHSSVQVTATVYAHLFDGAAQDEQARTRQETAYGTSLETSGGDGWQTEGVAEAASVSEIGSASGQRRPAANASG